MVTRCSGAMIIVEMRVMMLLLTMITTAANFMTNECRERVFTERQSLKNNVTVVLDDEESTLEFIEHHSLTVSSLHIRVNH